MHNVSPLIFVMLPSCAWAFLAGIDIGSEFSKFAIVLPKRQPEVVTNLHSQRKTPTAFSFVEQTRSFGEAALQHVASSAPNVARFFPQLLGRKVDNLTDPTFSGLPTTFFPFKLRADPDRSTYRLSVGDVDMSVEEVTAHFLHFGSHISTLAAEKKKLKGAVFTVPALASLRQRQALLDAAEIAGIPKVRLVHEISAAAIQRALDIEAPVPSKSPAADEASDEDLEPQEGDSPKEKLRKIEARRAKKERKKKASQFKTTRVPILFFNMGARHVEVCVVKYKFVKPSIPDSVTVKGCAASKEVAGHAFDLVIAEKMLEKAAPQYTSGELQENPKALQKILAQATKAKHKLSANKDTFFSVEALHNDLDFAGNITRDEFEEWCADLFPLITKPIETALKRSGLNLTSIKGVEVIGGGWRIPRVQQVLSEYIAEMRGPNASSLTLGQHLNGEEAAALGAAYFAATTGEGMSGPRLRPMPLEDVSSLEYSIAISKLNASQPGDDYSPRPQVVFKRGSVLGEKAQNLQLKLVRSDLRVTLFENGRAIQEHQMKGLHKTHKYKYPESPAPNVTFPIQLDANGIVVIGKAQATFQAIEKVEDAKKKSTSQKKVSKKVTLDDNVVYKGPAPMSRLQRLDARKRFKELGEQDRTATRAVAARNSLESYLFNSKDKLASPEIRELHSEEKIAEIDAEIDQVQAWLQDQGEGTSTQMYLAKLKALEREVDPMLNEGGEDNVRQESLERAGTAGTISAKEKAARIARKNEARARRKQQREL